MDEPGREALGWRAVTRREVEVLDAIAERLTNAEIAARLHLSERTVESHVSSLLQKLGGGNRLELARLAAARVPAWTALAPLPHQFEVIAHSGACVGRDRQMERLLACWGDAASRTTVAVLRGEAGIGKSRLTAEFATEVHRRGGRVAVGNCVDGAQQPYEPFMQAIADNLAGLPDVDLRRQLGTSADTVARLSADVAARVEVVRHDVVDPGRERAAVQAALHGYLVRAARSHPLLFVIEDLHWASVGTRDAVAHIARSGGTAPLMVLVTTRDERPFVDDGLEAFLGRLAALPSVDVIELPGLDVTAAMTVIDAVGGDLDPALGVRQTGGNPLFLRELARGGPESRSLRELVADRYDRLCARDLDVVDVAAVAGEQIDVALVAAAIDRSVDEILDTLERAEAARLIGPGARPGRLAFTQDVFRAARCVSLSAGRTMRLHAAVARALTDRAGDERVIADLARHACLAGPRFDPSAAANLARRAGDAASDATDHGEAAAHYRRALDAIDLAPDADERARLELSIRLGASLVLVGANDGQATLRAAAVAARRCGDPVALAEAVCAMSSLPGGGTAVGRDSDPLFTSLAEAALEALPPHEAAWRIRVQARLGVQLLHTAPDRATEIIRTAVSSARQLDDAVTLGRALLSDRFCRGPVDMEQRLACGTELIELGDRTGLEVFACVGRQQLWWCHRELGNRDEMDRWYEEAAERVRGPDLEQLSQDAAIALMDGELERADRVTDAMSVVWESGMGQVYIDALRAAIEDCRGHPPQIDTAERLSLAGSPYRSLMDAIAARTSARTGRASTARGMLDRARVDGFWPMHSGVAGATALACWAEVAAILEDASAADELDTLLHPVAGRLVDTGISVWDTVDRVRGLVRLTTGDVAAATQIALGAVAASRRRRTPILLGRELIVLAATMQRPGIDDAEAAEAAVDEALAIARRTGARIIAQDARLFLTVPAGAAHPADQFGLTRREREIVDLVASGATNAQIAGELGIAPATVRKHLEHAYEKLHVSTRTAAVARTNERAHES